jgi:hypothetical protein
MTIVEMWTSGARDVFGYRFRDAWHVRGWEQGKVPPRYFCEWEPTAQPAAQIAQDAQQMELFGNG